MTSLELLQEIDAWLSFNNSPSKEQISELRNDIKKHITEQLRIHDVSGSVCEHPKPWKNTPWGYKVCPECNDIVEWEQTAP